MSKTLIAERPKTASAFDFAPNYVEIKGYSIHYVEVGEGDPVLFIHGNPTSSYTFRNVLEGVATRSQRKCIAIDLLGFGKSEKAQVAHTCQLHAEIIEGFIDTLGLRNIILVAEDWGGFLGGYVMTQHPDWFQSAVLMETFLWPMTYKEDFDPSITMPFKLMRSPIGGLFSKGMNLMINKMIPEHCPISEESLQYFRDSVPTFKDKKAIGDFPKMLPVDQKPIASHEFALALQKGLPNINFPLLWIKADPGVVVSMANPIGMKRLEAVQEKIPQMVIKDFGEGYHFLSEENPEKVVHMIQDWISTLQ